METKSIQDVLYKYFKDEKTMYFQSSDAHKNIEGDCYLRFTIFKDRVNLWMGGESGEMCLRVTDDPVKLEEVINAIIY